MLSSTPVLTASPQTTMPDPRRQNGVGSGWMRNDTLSRIAVQNWIGKSSADCFIVRSRQRSALLQ